MGIYTAAIALLSLQAPPAAVVSAEHSPARLDELLASKDYTTLGKTIAGVTSQPDLVSDLAWLKSRMTEGNTAFISMLYSRLLWVAAGGLPEQQKHQWRQTAAMATLYAFAAMKIDGARCGDRSAPSHRIDQLGMWNPELWPFVRTLTTAEREILVKVTVGLEASTAPKREAIGDVEFLCRAGLEEMQYNLTSGTSLEVPTRPGGFGKTIEATGDGKYRPSERPEAEWRTEATKQRSSLATDLSRLLGPGKEADAK
jgi:hypothetical protein